MGLVWQLPPGWIGYVLQRERGVSRPAKAGPVDPGEEVWAQTFCGWEPTPRALRPLSVVQPLHIAHDLAPSPDAHRLPVQNPQAAHVLPDGANAAALAVLRGKNLRMHWGPQEERNSPRRSLVARPCLGFSGLDRPFKIQCEDFRKIPPKQVVPMVNNYSSWTYTIRLSLLKEDLCCR